MEYILERLTPAVCVSLDLFAVGLNGGLMFHEMANCNVLYKVNEDSSFLIIIIFSLFTNFILFNIFHFIHFCDIFFNFKIFFVFTSLL